MSWFRRRPRQPDDPVSSLDRSRVPVRLAAVVDDAVEANDRWRELVGSLGDGPIAERMRGVGERIELGVIDLHGTAVRVGDIERVLATLDPDRAVADFKRVKRAATAGADPPELAAVQERFESTQRLLNLIVDSEERLRVLDARLAAAVARGAEVALTASESGIGAIDSDLDGVLDELAAVRAGLDAVG